MMEIKASNGMVDMPSSMRFTEMPDSSDAVSVMSDMGSTLTQSIEPEEETKEDPP